jgi:hypothetical protein
VTDDRFELLVERHLEGSLSEDEARELLLAPASRLLDEIAMAALLVRAHGQPTDLAPRVQAALRPGAQKKEMVEGVLNRLPSRRRPARFLIPLAAAAAALVAALHLLGPKPETKDRSGAPTPQPLLATHSIRKAVAYLRTAELPSCRWQSPLPSDDLVLLALAQAGIPGTDPWFATLFERVRGAGLQRVYTVSVHAMLLQRLDPQKHRDRLTACARFLVDNQCLNGQWSYGAVTPALSAPLSGNNSCSIFAAFGLRACSDAGIRIPQETLDRAARWWRESRRPYPDVGDGEVAGWCYTREESPHRPYGSMTAGAVAALIIEDSLLGNDWRKDAAVQAGLRWLTKYFTVSENFGPVEELMAKELASDSPNPKTEVYYALWAMGQAAGVAGLGRLGGHDWYAEGLQELLSQQRSDGSWYGGAKRCQPVYDTCYAILFLTRSARPF